MANRWEVRSILKNGAVFSTVQVDTRKAARKIAHEFQQTELEMRGKDYHSFEVWTWNNRGEPVRDSVLLLNSRARALLSNRIAKEADRRFGQPHHGHSDESA